MSIVLLHWKNNASVVTLPLILKISLPAAALNNIGASRYGSYKINYRFDKKRWRKIGLNIKKEKWTERASKIKQTDVLASLLSKWVFFPGLIMRDSVSLTSDTQ